MVRDTALIKDNLAGVRSVLPKFFFYPCDEIAVGVLVGTIKAVMPFSSMWASDEQHNGRNSMFAIRDENCFVPLTGPRITITDSAGA